jgi:N-acetylmuramoyl-L-alanine amidase
MKKLNKLKKIAIAAGVLLSISAFTLSNNKVDAATFTHTVSYGQTYWKIANEFGVPLNSLESANHWKTLYAGENMVIPNSPISASDKNLMARLVHAEAQGEPFAGQVAVATVVLNRVLSPAFPDTVSGVIYQVSNGYHAFSTVANGTINQPANSTNMAAVNEALALMGKGSGSLYFYNPATTTSAWMKSLPVVCVIGHHVFAK